MHLLSISRSGIIVYFLALVYRIKFEV